MPWMWENSAKTLTLPVDFCRDQFIFDTDTPRQSIETLTKDQNQASWSRKGDISERCFYIPVDLVDKFPKNSNLFRDTIACVTQLYADSQYPESNIITSSIRQIIGNMGLAYSGERAAQIEEALIFARFYTVSHQPIYKTVNGKNIKYDSTFGFIESIDKEIEINGIPVKPSVAKTKITINGNYAQILRNQKLPKAPIPVAALEKANQAPRRLITPAKNLVYRLAARVPEIKTAYKISTLAEIMGFKTNRKDRLIKSINNTVEILYPIMIHDYYIEDDKYIISLAGRKVVGPNTP